MLAVTWAMTFSTSCEQKGKEIQLPENASAFLQEYFPNEEIVKIQKEGGKYEVKMGNSKEVDFDRKGEWIKVDCRKEVVPAAIVPAAIIEYIEANYPDVYVKEIEIVFGKYEVDLANGLDIIFDKDGEFVKIEK